MAHHHRPQALPRARVGWGTLPHVVGSVSQRVDVARLPDVARLAEPVRALVVRQEGVATVAQLAAGGFSARSVARWVHAGRWQRLHRGVVVLQSGPVLWRQRAHAALLVAGPGAALSHASAAAVHGFAAPDGRTTVVSVPAARAVVGHRGLVVHRRRVMPAA